jgi:hypothetical protein
LTRALSRIPNSLTPWLLTAFALVFSKCIVLLSFPEHGPIIMLPGFWVRWDSALYFSIAEKGYEAFPCWMRFTDYPPGSSDLCGNCGWLPGFPLLLSALMRLGIEPAWGAQIINHAFLLVFFRMLYQWLLKGLSLKRQLPVLGIAACWPGSVYFHAAFPIAMYALMACGFLYYLTEGKIVPASLFGMAAAITYSTGFFLALAAIPYIVFKYRDSWKNMLKHSIPSLGILLAFGSFLLVQWQLTGVPFAFFKTQSKYGHGFNSPLKIMGMLRDRALAAGDFNHAFPDWFALGMSVLMFIWLAYVIYTFRRNKEENLLHGTLIILYWFVPMSMSPYLAFHRQAAATIPLIRYIRDAPGSILCVALIVCIAVAILLNRLFMQDILI